MGLRHAACVIGLNSWDGFFESSKVMGAVYAAMPQGSSFIHIQDISPANHTALTLEAEFRLLSGRDHNMTPSPN